MMHSYFEEPHLVIKVDTPTHSFTWRHNTLCLKGCALSVKCVFRFDPKTH